MEEMWYIDISDSIMVLLRDIISNWQVIEQLQFGNGIGLLAYIELTYESTSQWQQSLWYKLMTNYSSPKAKEDAGSELVPQSRLFHISGTL